jgi:hypothetical protein
MVLYDNRYYDETNNAPLLFNATSELIDDNEECCLNMLYDNALDDAPMLIDNPPCLEVVTTLCEDKNDIIDVCNGTLTYESPTLFLNSPNYTLEDKFAYVEKYLGGLQLSLVPNICCSHDIKHYIDVNNYFERGKHANEFHNKLMILIMCLSYLSWKTLLVIWLNILLLLVTIMKEGVLRTLFMLLLIICCKYIMIICIGKFLFISIHLYTFPIHRNKVRLCCYYFCVWFFSLPGFNFSIIFIGLRVPWDPGIVHGTLPKEEGHTKVQAPS